VCPCTLPMKTEGGGNPRVAGDAVATGASSHRLTGIVEPESAVHY